MIDLRSDTVTRPTDEMRRVMAGAEVGDDVLGDDPTVRRLEERVAEVLGKEAAVYVPSGTMANQAAIRCHTRPGDEVVLEAESHTYYYEAGGPAALSGVTCRLIAGERGIFSGEQLKGALQPVNVHFPRTRLVVVENTHNRGGGSVWSLAAVREVSAAAREAGLALHLDGARLWNAAAATGVSEAAYAGEFDSVAVCFSKGLGAPVGSAVAGTGEFIAEVRRVRKLLGGGMRQVGIIAAGALYALEHHRGRLVEDHGNARRLAEGLAEQGWEVVGPVETNMVRIGTGGRLAGEVVEALRGEGVLILATEERCLRAVMHLGVAKEDVERALGAFGRVKG